MKKNYKEKIKIRITNKRMINEICDNSLDNPSKSQKTSEATVTVLPRGKNSNLPDPSTSNIINSVSDNNKLNNYSVGDIVLAKTGKYPIWPGIVMSDPETNTYYKTEKNLFMLHIYYFNDGNKRNWLRPNQIFEFNGKDNILREYPKLNANLSKRRLKEKWNKAVDEAESLTKMDRDNRLNAFSSNDILEYTKKINKEQDTSSSDALSKDDQQRGIIEIQPTTSSDVQTKVSDGDFNEYGSNHEIQFSEYSSSDELSKNDQQPGKIEIQPATSCDVQTKVSDVDINEYGTNHDIQFSDNIFSDEVSNNKQQPEKIEIHPTASGYIQTNVSVSDFDKFVANHEIQLSEYSSSDELSINDQQPGKIEIQPATSCDVQTEVSDVDINEYGTNHEIQFSDSSSSDELDRNDLDSVNVAIHLTPGGFFRTNVSVNEFNKFFDNQKNHIKDSSSSDELSNIDRQPGKINIHPITCCDVQSELSDVDSNEYGTNHENEFSDSDSNGDSDSGDLILKNLQPDRIVVVPSTNCIIGSYLSEFDVNEYVSHHESPIFNYKTECTKDPMIVIPELCKFFYSNGWITGTGGGISIKLSNCIYISPSEVHKDRIEPEDLFVQDIHGVDIKMPSPEKNLSKSQCTPIFMCSYTMRDAGAVIHINSLEVIKLCLLNSGKDIRIQDLEIVKGIYNEEKRKYYDIDEEVIIPIIENLKYEKDLVGMFKTTLKTYPMTSAVLIRNHGMYIWGKNWQSVKSQCECYNYAFKLMIFKKLNNL